MFFLFTLIGYMKWSSGLETDVEAYYPTANGGIRTIRCAIVIIVDQVGIQPFHLLVKRKRILCLYIHFQTVQSDFLEL